MKPIELSPERQEQVIHDLIDIGIDPYEYGLYLREKVEEDRNVNDVKKGILDTQEFLDRKALLVSMEYLSVILTKTK